MLKKVLGFGLKESGLDTSNFVLSLRLKYINEYISTFPEDIQEVLQKIRKTIFEAVPEGEEAIRYSMPTLRLNGKNVVHFAAFQNHFGFYPAPSGINQFEKELAPYITGKGTIQFPKDKPIPYYLIKKVTLFRAKEAQK